MCCSGKRSIRQSVKPAVSATPQKKIVYHKTMKQSIPVSAQRQQAIVRKPCEKCGAPTMLVHIAGRERTQCTSKQCKFVKK